MAVAPEKATTGKGLAAAAKAFQVGQLISLDWVLGVAVKSSQCSQLNSPYVQIQLRVADNNNKVTNHHIELTLPEFQEFTQQFKRASNALDGAA